MLKIYLDCWNLSTDTHFQSARNRNASIEQRLVSLSMNSRVDISLESSGKPVVLQPEGWYFNLSHSGDFAFCAYSTAAIGLDLELQKKRNFSLIMESWFREKEQILLQDSMCFQNFYTIWTRKEAWLKMYGKSIWDLGETPDMIEVSPGIQSYEMEWNEKRYSLSWSLDNPDYQKTELIPFLPSSELIPITHF